MLLILIEFFKNFNSYFVRCVSLYGYVGLEHPESQKLYTESSQKIEKWIKILNVALMKISPALTIWPAVITSLITYFTTDLGNAALELPGPMW